MKTLGIIGLGVFGRLMARHLKGHVVLKAFDPSASAQAFAHEAGIDLVPLAEIGQQDIIIIATPVEKIREAVVALKPHLRAGSVVMDVGSVKMLPAKILQEEVPEDVEILCTHPLFGPQSGKNGIAGLKIAVCPIRGDSATTIITFLQTVLGLDVILTTPEDHDRDMAAAQGLTHMIAKVLVGMEPLPKQLTTKSFDLIMEAVEMVRYDSPELFLAIERDNPFAASLRQKFFAQADALRGVLETVDHSSLGGV